MISPSPKMLSELLETLDDVGAGMDAMDLHELAMDADSYRNWAAFSIRMLGLVPHNQPGLIGLLQRRDSLADIWGTLCATRTIQNDAPKTWVMQEAILAAKQPAQFKGRPRERRKP